MVCAYHSNRERELVKVNGKVIGYFKGNKFIKQVYGSKHKLRTPEAWAIDANAWDSEVKTKAEEFIVVDKETGNEYHCSIKTFDTLKKRLDRGFGPQYYLTLTKWNVRENGYRQLTLWEVM